MEKVIKVDLSKIGELIWKSSNPTRNKEIFAEKATHYMAKLDEQLILFLLERKQCNKKEEQIAQKEKDWY